MGRPGKNIKRGDKYGLYTVISEPFYNKDKERLVKLQCLCGSIICAKTGQLSGKKMCVKCARNFSRKYKVGDRKFKLTIINYESIKVRDRVRTYLIVKCDCGNLSRICSDYFGITQTCGCSLLRHGQDSPLFKGVGYINRSYYNRIKVWSTKLGREFTISMDYINKLFIKQEFKCALTGLPIELHVPGKRITTASLDRIDSSKGYIEGNVQWVHKDINTLKTNFKQDRFIELCKMVAKYN